MSAYYSCSYSAAILFFSFLSGFRTHVCPVAGGDWAAAAAVRRAAAPRDDFQLRGSSRLRSVSPSPTSVSVVFLCCCHATSCAPHGLRYGRFGSGATPDQVDRTVTWRSSSCVFASLPPVPVVYLGSSGSRRRTAIFVISRTVVADLRLHVKLGCFCMDPVIPHVTSAHSTGAIVSTRAVIWHAAWRFGANS
jgi:hypothetical protein